MKNLNKFEIRYDPALGEEESFKKYCLLSNIIVQEGYKTIPRCAFSELNVKTVRSVKLPNSLETIGELAFYLMENLHTVELPKNLKTIKNGAFRESGLRELVCDESLTEIESHAFKECELLESVSFNRNLRVIGKEAFVGSSLAKLNIPGSVISIEKCAFKDLLTDLSYIEFEPSENTLILGEAVFDNSIGMLPATIVIKRPVIFPEDSFFYANIRRLIIDLPEDQQNKIIFEQGSFRGSKIQEIECNNIEILKNFIQNSEFNKTKTKIKDPAMELLLHIL